MMLKQIQLKAQKLFIKAKNRRTISLVVVVLVTFVGIGLVFLQLSTGAEASWWPGGEQWLKRKNLELVNTTNESLAATTTVAVTVNTKELYQTGKLKADCSDLRVLYQPNNTTATEITRHLVFSAGTDCTTSETTKVYFPLQATLAASARTGDYYMYYANGSASSPSSTDRAFDIGDKQALLVCPFNGTTTCAAGETPSTENGPIRYQGDKSALYFKPRDASISLGNPSSLRNLPQGTFTIETWFNMYTPSPNDYYNYLWASNASGGPDFRVTIMPHDRQIQFLITCSTQNARAYSNYSAFSLNQWNHFAVTYDDQGDRTPRMYLNGQEMTYLTSSACQGDYGGDSSYNKYIGASEWATPRLSATLDEYRISNVVRYTSNFTPQTTPFARDNSTLLLYHFDENGNDPRNSGRALDDSGNNNHGTITGAKYVSGLVGVDGPKGVTPSVVEGSQPSQAYASHEGIFVEEGTTNKITNPSFEHATYNTNWTASGGTATENTDPTYVKFGTKSYRLSLSDSTDRTVTTSINAGNTNTHVLSAYVYRGTTGNVGGTVDATVAQLVFDGTAQTTTYTNVGGGWWRLTYSGAGVASAVNYGIQVNEDSGILYIDGVQLEENPYQYVTSYADGSLGEGYSWTGTPNESTSTRAASEVAGYDREGNFSCEQGTISFWMKKQTVYPAVSEYYPRILALRRIGEDTIGFHQGYRGGNLTFQLTGYNPSYYSYSTDYNISGWALNSWHHVVGTYEDNGTAVLYVDGVQRNSVNLGDLAADCGSTFEFRTTLQSSNRPGNQIIADLRSYNAPLSSNEVVDLYYSGLVSHSQSFEVDRFTGSKGQDPVAIWRFDESYGSTAHDSSRYKNDLTLSDTSWCTQSLGACTQRTRTLKFNGTYSIASRSAGQASNLNFGSQNFSLSGWFRHPVSTSDIDTLISKYTGNKGYEVYLNASGQVCFRIGDGTNTDEACTAASYADSSWHHFSAVYVNDTDEVEGGSPSTRGVYLFIDGNQAAADTGMAIAAGTNLSNNADFTLGADSDRSDFYDGFLDDIVIYPYARSTNQVKTDFAGGQTSTLVGSNTDDFLTTGLVGYWKMDEAGNTSRSDRSGNGNTLAQSAGDTIDAATGKFGSGADFENSSSEAETLYIDDSSHNGLDITGQITIATWVRRESIQWGLNNLVSKHHSDSGQRSYMLTLNGTHLQFWLSPDGNSTTEVSIAEAVPLTDTWYHIVGAYDGTRMMLYINGSLASDPVSYNGGIFNSTANFRIGGSDSGWYFDGVIDETRIYNRALSPDEIRQLYEWAPGPVGYWDLNEGTGITAYDKTGTNNHGTLGGDGLGSDLPEWNRGQYGNALQFGTDDFVSVADAPELQISGAMTLSVWMKPETASNYIGTIVGKGGPSGQRSYYIGIQSDTSFIFVVASGPSTSYITSITYDWTQHVGEWMHLAAVFDPGVKTEFYINGTKVAGRTDSVPSSQHSNNSLPLLIGARNSDSSVPSFHFQEGLIDEVKVYNYARSAGQIVEDMNAGHPAPGSPVGSAIGHWKFDEGYGDTAHNSGNQASALNGILDSTYTPAWTSHGKIGGALDFDGDRNYVSISDNPALQPDEITFSAWIKLDTALSAQPNSYPAVVSKRSGNFGFAMYFFRSDEEIQISLGNGSSRVISETLVSGIDWSQWHQISFTHDGTYLKVYVDGKLMGSYDRNFNISYNTTDLWIGDINDYTASSIDGQIDDVQLFGSALSGDQINILYNAKSGISIGVLGESEAEQLADGQGASPVAQWNFDEKTGTTAQDTSGNGNSGTLGGDGVGSDVPTWKGAGDCKNGACLEFDGGDYIGIPTDYESVVESSAKTITAWALSTGLGSDRRIFSLYNSSGTTAMSLHQGAGDTWRGSYRNAGGYVILDSNVAVQEGVWTHLAIVQSGTSVRIYVNGALANSATDAIAPTVAAATNADIGAYDSTGFGVHTEFWIGRIDDIRMYDYARTQAQIAYDYNRGAPVGWWNFDECQGTTAHDSSGRNNHGTIMPGTAPYSSVGTCGGNASSEMWAAGATGKDNASLGFDGSDDYVQIPHNSVFNITNDITIAAWIKRGSIGPWTPIVAKTNGSVWNYDLYIEDSSNELIFYSDDTTPDHIGTGAGAITDTTNWHHVAVTRRGSSVTIYIDGKAVTTGTMTGAFGTSTAPLLIGCDDGSCGDDTFHGNIDDVRIYNYALSGTQVRTIMNNGAVRFGP